MSTEVRTKGRWIHRLGIHLLTIVLGILVYWLLGFLVRDIETLPGPDFAVIEKEFVDPSLSARRRQLDEQIAETNAGIEQVRERQRALSDSSGNLRETINQLLALQKLSLEKGLAFPESNQQLLSGNQQAWLDNQEKYQQLSRDAAALVEQKQRLENERKAVQAEERRQREPAEARYGQLWDAHRRKLAFYQLGLLLPILVVAAVLLVRKRTSPYFPIVLAVGVAVLLKVGLVIHEYFPSRLTKYVLIGALLVVVAWVLVYLIRMVTKPKAAWLLRQYREAYERFLCPVCEYPIRVGPRRYLFWTRHTVNKVVAPGGGANEPEECYTCPNCGSTVYEPCAACGKVRHALLTYCAHCGAAKTGG